MRYHSFFYWWSKITQIRTLPRRDTEGVGLVRCEVINRGYLEPSIGFIPHSNGVYEQVDDVPTEVLILDVSVAELSQPPYNMFLMKNNFGYADKQEVVLTPNNPLGEQKSNAELEERYLESVADENLTD